MPCGFKLSICREVPIVLSLNVAWLHFHMAYIYHGEFFYNILLRKPIARVFKWHLRCLGRLYF